MFSKIILNKEYLTSVLHYLFFIYISMFLSCYEFSFSRTLFCSKTFTRSSGGVTYFLPHSYFPPVSTSTINVLTGYSFSIPTICSKGVHCYFRRVESHHSLRIALVRIFFRPDPNFSFKEPLFAEQTRVVFPKCYNLNY